MLSQYSYPIICSDNFAQTIAFYEDHLDFIPEVEMKGFAILKRDNYDATYISIIDAKHDVLPKEYKRPVQGMILNYPVDNVIEFYDHAYHEGLKLLSEPKDASCGRKHFYIEDPNGILIDVAQNIELSCIVGTEEINDLFVIKQAF